VRSVHFPRCVLSVPSVHEISLLPSPLKSPMPTIDQPVTSVAYSALVLMNLRPRHLLNRHFAAVLVPLRMMVHIGWGTVTTNSEHVFVTRVQTH
jgi:hypothetical protein